MILATAGPLLSSEIRTGRVSFGVFGDLPYNAREEALFPALIEEMNEDPDLDFVVHVGDFKNGGSTECSDQVFRRARSWFDLSRHPLIYTPGDNEWTDCYRLGLGQYDPLERLAALRRIFFPDEASLGQRPLPLARQSMERAYGEFRENARWTAGRVLFATLHVVGSNNNLGRAPEEDREHDRRTNAALSWMGDAFAHARAHGMEAVVLMMHGNPAFEKNPAQRTGFNRLLAELETVAREFKKPVLLIHGDTHSFRMDKPLRAASDGRPVENLTRVEIFGSPYVEWVKVTIDPEAPASFRIEPARFSRNRRGSAYRPSHSQRSATFLPDRLRPREPR